jgi:CopG family nickel-responsive transcriptional regulator
MPNLARFGVSVERDLLKTFDQFIMRKNYSNRSEAFRDIIRKELVAEEWEGKGEVVGVITLIYDHHKRQLGNKLTDIQHDFQGLILSTQHMHLAHNSCLEIIAAKGSCDKVRGLANTLKVLKGVKHGALNMSSTGKVIK